MQTQVQLIAAQIYQSDFITQSMEMVTESFQVRRILAPLTISLYPTPIAPPTHLPMAKARRAKRRLHVSVEMDMEELLSSSVGEITASTTRTSADGRRIYHHTLAIPSPSPTKRQRKQNVEEDAQGQPTGSDGFESFIDESLWEPVETVAIPSKPAAKRYVSSVSRVPIVCDSSTPDSDNIGRAFEGMAAVCLPGILDGVHTS